MSNNTKVLKPSPLDKKLQDLLTNHKALIQDKLGWSENDIDFLKHNLLEYSAEQKIKYQNMIEGKLQREIIRVESANKHERLSSGELRKSKEYSNYLDVLAKYNAMKGTSIALNGRFRDLSKRSVDLKNSLHSAELRVSVNEGNLDSIGEIERKIDNLSKQRKQTALEIKEAEASLNKLEPKLREAKSAVFNKYEELVTPIAKKLLSRIKDIEDYSKELYFLHQQFDSTQDFGIDYITGAGKEKIKQLKNIVKNG
jgi:chromosome segregation ATPase